ncbi:MAG: hypothetical protein AAGF29_04690 [Pseudomonadota bacterium]
MKTLAVAVLMTAMTALPVTSAFADGHAAKPTPAQMEQIAMSEQLIALGKARKDAILVLAGIKLRSQLDGETAAVPTEMTSRDDAFAAAMEAAKGNDVLTGVVEDVQAEGSRDSSGRMTICTGHRMCF